VRAGGGGSGGGGVTVEITFSEKPWRTFTNLAMFAEVSDFSDGGLIFLREEEDWAALSN
jgi:hypothetical protein